MAMPTGNGKIPKYTDSERLMIPKTDCLLTDQEGEESISMDFQVCQPQKTRVLCHLKRSSPRVTVASSNKGSKS